MILITGAAGKTGRAVIRSLSKRGATLRALVRRSDQAASLEALGAAEVIVGDLGDHISVDQAVRGVNAIYHIAPNVSPDEVTFGKTVIAAAQSAKIEHFVYHSVLHPQIEAMPHHWHKMRVEELLFESGLPFTILQPTAYMQNILAQWDQIHERGKFRVPYSPTARISLVDLEDVAQAAAIVLTGQDYIGATLELVGTPAMSQTEVADMLSKMLNRPVKAEAIPRETWEQNARSSGLGEYQISTLIQMFKYYDQHGLHGNQVALSGLLGRQPTSFADFVKRVARERDDDSRIS